MKSRVFKKLTVNIYMYIYNEEAGVFMKVIVNIYNEEACLFTKMS
jgi:hypothetical protein